MSATETTKSIIYNSRYCHPVDAQRRVLMPLMWRPAKEGTEFTMIRWPKHPAGECLRVLPPQEMAKLMEDLDRMPNSDPKKDFLSRYIGEESVQITLDKAGRISLPKDMASAAAITEEAVFAGRLRLFEIWNPERHKAVKAADEPRAPIAFEMMG